MAAITFYHEVFGSVGDSRQKLQTLDLDVSTISVADVIRLRIEAAYEAEGPAQDAPDAGSPQWLRRHAANEPRPQLEEAIEQARQGLAANAYFLLVNGRQVRDLHEEVALDEGNSAVFLELVPLKGG
jgi:hypothetical protein